MRSSVPPIFFSVLLGFFLVPPGFAFHSGGVAECGGCHSMHSPNPAGTSLLTGSDPSSTCLSCHERAGDPAKAKALYEEITAKYAAEPQIVEAKIHLAELAARAAEPTP